MDELGAFPLGWHDDQVDALSLVFAKLSERQPIWISAEAMRWSAAKGPDRACSRDPIGDAIELSY